MKQILKDFHQKLWRKYIQDWTRTQKGTEREGAHHSRNGKLPGQRGEWSERRFERASAGDSAVRGLPLNLISSCPLKKMHTLKIGRCVLFSGQN